MAATHLDRGGDHELFIWLQSVREAVCGNMMRSSGGLPGMGPIRPQSLGFLLPGMIPLRTRSRSANGLPHVRLAPGSGERYLRDVIAARDEEINSQLTNRIRPWNPHQTREV
ncbi:MAG TPA: hypothetical protein VFH32_05845, partial [Rubrobacteraceae bacterium]|nr:hypothetical protein [Rubrobacteraceae bacterium]